MPMNMRTLAVGRLSLLLAGLLCTGALAASSGAGAQAKPKLLILSQPGPNTPKDQVVDLASYLERGIGESGRYEIIVYKATLDAVRAAVEAKQVAPRDLDLPMSRETARRVARLSGAHLLLLVSARYGREGVSAEAEMEMNSAADQWNTVFNQALAPFKSSGKKSGLLEGINAHTQAITRLVTGAPMQPIPLDPAQPVKPPTGDKNEPVQHNGNGVKPPDDSANQKTIRPATPQDPTPTPSAYALLIERARRTGDLSGLIVGLRRAVNERPRDAGLRRDLIMAYRTRGMSEAAHGEAVRAVALAPGDATLRRLLGDTLMDSGNSDAAFREYQEAVRLGSKDAANLVALGDACWNNARPDDALKCYTDAAQAEPKNPLPHRRLARLYIQRARYADCAAAIKTAQECTLPNEQEAFNADYAGLLSVVESIQYDALAKMQAARKGFADSTRTREQAFKDLSDQKQGIEALAAFLDTLPATTFARIQALYAQAAALLMQAFESALEYTETGNTPKDEETNLLRIEAQKQLNDAAKKLKAATAAPK